ncbi:unnamed protein product [Mytilus coruscus]|uniref:B box-type domain-containing protein n=1 Tax=Mytilus coruscus TaxID=42192 RepID=A0A6J8DRF3_MYTCO|nr:unnamed protein product [Mytilus coruscus]
MTKAQDNKLFFTVVKSSEVKCLSTFTLDSKTETFISISPVHARGIHATNKNILIGFRDNGERFPLQEKSRRGIFVYDYNCRHMRTYEYDTNNHRLFSLPEAITTNINEDICVIDKTNNTREGRVVVLGKYGNVKWIYNGHASINSKNNLNPWDLVTTSKGLILVTDRNSNTVHMLSMEGCLVTSLNETHGTERPLCLNIDQKGQLQIGCSSIGTKSGLAKLHTACKVKTNTKIKKTEVHQVLDLKEFSNLGASEIIRHLDLKNIQCSMHNAEQCIIYFEDCKLLLCAVCLLESHRTHNLTKINEVYDMKELDSKLCEKLPFYTDLEKELKKIKSVENDQYNEIKQRILKKESELKEVITKERENLITEVDRLCLPREKTLNKQLKDIVEKNTRILEDTTEVFGSILTVPECKITETFTSEIQDSIYNIKTLENNTNILCTSKKSTIKSFELKDSKCITTSIANDTEEDIIDMTKAQDNKLLFTVVASSEIKCLSTFKPDSKIETFTSISPLNARGIYATNKNILIGFRDSGKVFPLREESRRGILVYDYTCRHMRTYEYDTNNQRLLSFPGALKTNINEDICVIDLTNNTPWEGRVVVLGKHGNLKWTYNGHPSINTKNFFNPFNLLTTSKGLIIVSDRDSTAVHLLSMEGCLVWMKSMVLIDL